MNNRIDAIYARQSVDKKDSISIESQIEFCKYELKGGNCKEYTDKGYSGKNTDRPKFQELVRDIKRGLIAKVVVYKLDRISRSILDFANMMELFQQYNVEFVSSTEKFDTSTPMGRAMLNICIVFAQLERETIQKRVTDAYYSRSQRGFKMGGKAPYGFHTEPIKMDGINTKKLVVNPDEAANIRLMFEMYAQPTTSYGDITRYFAEQGILFNGKELIRPTLAQMLRNPVYVQADLDVYEFFKSQGTVIVNDAADFTGMNGCYLYQGRDVKPSKKNDLKDQMLVLAPHEGIVPSDIWLTCRKKLMNNMWPHMLKFALTEPTLIYRSKITNDGNIITDVFPSKNNTYSDVLLPLSSYSGSTTISVANIKNVIKKYSPSARVNGLNKEKLLQLLEDIRKTNNITNADLCNKFADEIYLPKIVLKKADIPLSLRSQFIDLR